MAPSIAPLGQTMNGLAEIVVDYLLTIMFAEGDVIDADYQVRLQESMHDQISPLSDAERKTLSQVAQRRLEEIESGPDEYGYNPGLLVSSEQRAFLSSLATGELYDGLNP